MSSNDENGEAQSSDLSDADDSGQTTDQNGNNDGSSNSEIDSNPVGRHKAEPSSKFPAKQKPTSSSRKSSEHLPPSAQSSSCDSDVSIPPSTHHHNHQQQHLPPPTNHQQHHYHPRSPQAKHQKFTKKIKLPKRRKSKIGNKSERKRAKSKEAIAKSTYHGKSSPIRGAATTATPQRKSIRKTKPSSVGCRTKSKSKSVSIRGKNSCGKSKGGTTPIASRKIGAAAVEQKSRGRSKNQQPKQQVAATTNEIVEKSSRRTKTKPSSVAPTNNNTTTINTNATTTTNTTAVAANMIKQILESINAASNVGAGSEIGHSSSSAVSGGRSQDTETAASSDIKQLRPTVKMTKSGTRTSKKTIGKKTVGKMSRKVAATAAAAAAAASAAATSQKETKRISMKVEGKTLRIPNPAVVSKSSEDDLLSNAKVPNKTGKDSVELKIDSNTVKAFEKYLPDLVIAIKKQAYEDAAAAATSASSGMATAAATSAPKHGSKFGKTIGTDVDPKSAITNDEMEDLNDELSDLNTSISTLRHSYGSIIRSLANMQNRRSKKKALAPITTPTGSINLGQNAAGAAAEGGVGVAGGGGGRGSNSGSGSGGGAGVASITIDDICARITVDYAAKYNMDRFLDASSRDNVFEELFREVSEINTAMAQFRAFFNAEGYFQRDAYQKSEWQLTRPQYRDCLKVLKDLSKVIATVLRAYNTDLLDMFRINSSI